jgi:Zn-dependent peptidase ImmA (M78 family)
MRTTSPDRDAQELLGTVWDRPLPVDPFQIATSLGIKVYTAGLDAKVSGMLIKRRSQDPEIYVNARDSDNRQRFTVAHELGHYLKRSAAGEEEWEDIDYRGPLTSQGTDEAEIYANKFAASLLMPGDEVRRLFKEYGPTGTAVLAYEFGVSEDAMNFRLINLGLKR